MKVGESIRQREDMPDLRQITNSCTRGNYGRTSKRPKPNFKLLIEWNCPNILLFKWRSHRIIYTSTFKHHTPVLGLCENARGTVTIIKFDKKHMPCLLAHWHVQQNKAEKYIPSRTGQNLTWYLQSLDWHPYEHEKYMDKRQKTFAKW